MKAVRIHQFGDAHTLRHEEVPTPAPAKGEALVKLEAIGLNYIDVYQRTGLYPLPLPQTLGLEAAGTVQALGSGVTDWRAGDRAAYATHQGAYAQYAAVPVEKLVKVPAGVALDLAAAVMLQGMTAHYLTHDTYRLKPGDTALVHAAAGGVGLLLVQVAKRLGARVIATASTEEKARLAQEAGADAVILYTKAPFQEDVRRLTGGRGVDVVYDSVGQATFEGSLASLRLRGLMALFGQSSGPVGPFNLQELNAKGSLFITRPSLFHHVAAREELLKRAQDLFQWIAAGQLQVRVDRTLPLSQAAEAHRALESRQTQGKVLLDPAL